MSRGKDSYNTSSPSTTVVTVVRNHSHTCALLHLLPAATIQGWRLFRSRALDCAVTIRGWPLFEGGVYSKKYDIQLDYWLTFGVDVSVKGVTVLLSRSKLGRVLSDKDSFNVPKIMVPF